MHNAILVRVLKDEHPRGGFAREAVGLQGPGELIEPTYLASGQAASTGCYRLLGLLGAEVARDIKEHFFNTDCSSDGRVWEEVGLCEQLGLLDAVADYVGGACEDIAVENFSRRTQVDVGEVVASPAVPDRTTLRGARELQLQPTGLAPGVLCRGCELLGLHAHLARHLRGKRYVE